MISDNEYKSLRSQYDTHMDALRKLGRNWSFPEDNLPPCPTSDQISAIETYEFINNPPERYFSYVNEDNKTMTTWTGEVLGKIVNYTPYRCPAFGSMSRRVAIRVKAINGREYYGTYYKSSGDYCRVKACKH